MKDGMICLSPCCETAGMRHGACACSAPACMCCDAACVCLAPCCMYCDTTCACSAPACMCCGAVRACSAPVGMCCDKQRTYSDRAGDRARRRRPAGRDQTASLVEMESDAAAGCRRRVVACLRSTAAAAAAAKSDSARRKSGPTVGLPATAARDSVRHLRLACKWLAPSDGSLPTEIHVKKKTRLSQRKVPAFSKRHKLRTRQYPKHTPLIYALNCSHLMTSIADQVVVGHC